MAGLRGALLLALALGVGGCASQPLDLLPAAERASAEGRLLQVLAYTDQIPQAHPGVERARELARDARMRLRRSVELAVQAIELQAGWRDAEALVALAEAKRMWPDVPGLAARVRLSHARMARTGHGGPGDLAWPTIPLAVTKPTQ